MEEDGVPGFSLAEHNYRLRLLHCGGVTWQDQPAAAGALAECLCRVGGYAGLPACEFRRRWSARVVGVIGPA